MLTRLASILTATLALLSLMCSSAQALSSDPTGASKPDKTGYVTASGIKYYFEIHGTGEPLLLLHGGLGHTEMFGPILTALAQKRQVIGVDLQGHGRTALGVRGE